MILQADSDGAKTFQIDILDVHRRRLEDHLKLKVLVETVRVLPVTAVGGPTTGLDISDAVRVRTQDAKEGFWMHRACAYLNVIGLLEYATLFHPKL